MPKIVNVHEAKTHLSRLMAEVEAGEEVIIARAGEPVVRLVPIRPNRVRQPGTRRGAWPQLPDDFFDPIPDGELDSWGL